MKYLPLALTAPTALITTAWIFTQNVGASALGFLIFSFVLCVMLAGATAREPKTDPRP